MRGCARGAHRAGLRTGLAQVVLRVRTDTLSVVTMLPHTRLRTTCSAGDAYSGRTRDRSHSSSSAASIGSAVKMPGPMSERATRITTASSGSMTTQAVSSRAAGACASQRPGSAPTSSPPATALIPKTKPRRVTPDRCSMTGDSLISGSRWPRQSGPMPPARWPRGYACRCRRGTGCQPSPNRCPCWRDAGSPPARQRPA